jgi:hypothetical protein
VNITFPHRNGIQNAVARHGGFVARFKQGFTTMSTSTVFMQTSDGEIIETSNPQYYKDCKQLSKAAGKVAYRDQCRKELRKILKPGGTVYTILRSVSSSGMTRVVSVVIAHKGDIRNITHLVAGATEHSLKFGGGFDGIVLTGCGMDMGWNLVYVLGASLWPNGTRKPHGTRNGEPDSNGGYALHHEWL